MKKFKRFYEEHEKLNDRYINSNQKSGFLLDEIFTTKDRDIFTPYIEMLTNPANTGIYTTILAAYREIPYSEELLQAEDIKKTSGKDYRRITGDGIFSLTHPMHCKIYECIFIYTPVTFGKTKDKKSNSYKIVPPTKAIDIYNTLKELDKLKSDYIVPDKVTDFLKSQLNKHEADMSNDSDKNLFVMKDKNEIDIVKMFVPLVKNNGYYEDNGNKRYPFIQELYYYHKTSLDQVKFHVKEVKSLSNAAFVDSYLTVVRPIGYDYDIIAIKQYRVNFYNPFYFIEKHEAYELYNDLITDNDLTEKTKILIDNTFKHYESDLEEREALFKNLVPNIKVIELITGEEIEEIDEDELMLAEEAEYSGEMYAEENNIIKDSKGYSTIDKTIIKSAIMGFNGTRKFGYYGHLNEYLLRVYITKLSDTKRKKNYNNLASKKYPLPLQLLATINQNSDMFTTSGLTHPLDVFMLLSFKKYIYFTPRKDDKTKASDKVANKEKYLDFDTEYRLIDPITTKSESSAGLQANVIPYKYLKNRYHFNN